MSNAFIRTSNLLRKLQYKAPKQEDPIKGWNSLVPPPPASMKMKFIDMHRWRLQLAMMVDCSPNYILTNNEIRQIILKNPDNSTEMQILLDSFFPKFLTGKQGKIIFQVFSSGMRAPEFSPKCHNCALNSHQAWACWKSKDKDAWKRYMNAPENATHKKRQYERRMRKLKENRERRNQQF